MSLSKEIKDSSPSYFDNPNNPRRRVFDPGMVPQYFSGELVDKIRRKLRISHLIGEGTVVGGVLIPYDSVNNFEFSFLSVLEEAMRDRIRNRKTRLDPLIEACGLRNEVIRTVTDFNLVYFTDLDLCGKVVRVQSKPQNLGENLTAALLPDEKFWQVINQPEGQSRAVILVRDETIFGDEKGKWSNAFLLERAKPVGRRRTLGKVDQAFNINLIDRREIFNSGELLPTFLVLVSKVL